MTPSHARSFLICPMTFSILPSPHASLIAAFVTYFTRSDAQEQEILQHLPITHIRFKHPAPQAIVARMHRMLNLAAFDLFR